MAEIRAKELYLVTVTEYEKGWGQRPCPEETKVFDSYSEAQEYVDKCNVGTYEIYWRATVKKLV